MTTAIASTAVASTAVAPTPLRDASSALDLLDRSRQSLLAACQSAVVVERFTQAQLGALRAAAALVAARPTTWRPQGPHSLWELLPTVAPELSEWADFFELTTPRPRRSPAISSREADDLLRQAETFLDLVCRSLGLPVPQHHGDVLVPTSTPAVPAAAPSAIPTAAPTAAPTARPTG